VSITAAEEHALEQAQQTLIKHGIRPGDVAQFGLSEEGYLEFQRSAITGKILRFADETPHVMNRAWPEGFPFQEFLKLVHTYLGAVL
jgi:hypothetical protein